MSKVILVTGATGGFGQVLTPALNQAGHTVYGTSRNPDHHPDSQVPLLPLDVTTTESAKQCIKLLLDAESRIDVVINCVNELVIAATEEQDWDEVADLFNTNVLGAMRVCQAALPHFKSKNTGLIINMSSMGGLLAVPYMGAYTSSKFALEAMTEALYHEVRDDGIDVVIMQPVAMAIDRPAAGDHLRLGRGVAAESFSHRVVDIMAEDSRTSDLSPEQVAQHILKVIDARHRSLRVPLDRAAMLSKLKRILPQAGINKLIDGLIARGRAA